MHVQWLKQQKNCCFLDLLFTVSFFYHALKCNKALQPRQQTDMLQGTLLLLSLHRVFPDTPAGIAPHSPSGPPNHAHTHTYTHTHTHTNRHIDTHTHPHTAITAACWNFLGLLVMRHLFSVPPIEDSFSLQTQSVWGHVSQELCIRHTHTHTHTHTVRFLEKQQEGTKLY